jgi:hypothetical protein
MGRSEVTEQTLIGKWSATDKSGIGRAFKLKSEHPDAKGSEVLAAAKILAATSLDLKKDGVFTLVYGAGKYGGSWKFDKQDAMVELEVTTVNDQVADVKNLLTGAFLGVIDREDGTMRLYPIDRKGYEASKKRGDKGPENLSVLLSKGG